MNKHGKESQQTSVFSTQTNPMFDNSEKNDKQHTWNSIYVENASRTRTEYYDGQTNNYTT